MRPARHTIQPVRVVATSAVWIALGCGRVGFTPPGVALPPVDAAVDAASCDPAFTTLPNAPHRYLLQSAPLPWAAAVNACAAFGPGHTLSLPADDNERLALATVAASILETRWWLGGSDTVTEGTWLDLDGNPLTYLPWASGEPNNSGGDENCLDLLVLTSEGAARNRFFDDRTCTAAYPYICACTLGE